MRREFKVEANVVPRVQVAYRETIRKKVDKVEYTHKKADSRLRASSSQGADELRAPSWPTRPPRPACRRGGGEGADYGVPAFLTLVTRWSCAREYIPSEDVPES